MKMSFEHLYLLGSLVLVLFVYRVWGLCQDLDSQACVLMKLRNPSICDDALGQQVCPEYCGLCPLSCIHCVETLTNYTHCIDVQRCQTGQRCFFAELYNTADGSRSYKMSCVDRDACSGSALLDIIGRRRSVTIKSDCCDTYMCNSPPYFTTTSSTMTSISPTAYGHDHTSASQSSMTSVYSSSVATDAPVATTTGFETSPTTSTLNPTPTNNTTTSMTVTNQVTATTKTGTTLRPVPHCNRDVYFMIQDNKYQHANDIEQVRNFLTAFVNAIAIGVDYNVVELTLLQHRLVTVNARHHQTQQDLVNEIPLLPFHTRDSGIPVDAIGQLLLYHSHDARHNFANIVIFIVDQNANLLVDHHAGIPDISPFSNNVIVVNIGGSPSAGGFSAFASSPSRTLPVASYVQLLSILPDLLRLICS